MLQEQPNSLKADLTARPTRDLLSALSAHADALAANVQALHGYCNRAASTNALLSGDMRSVARSIEGTVRYLRLAACEAAPGAVPANEGNPAVPSSSSESSEAA